MNANDTLVQVLCVDFDDEQFETLRSEAFRRTGLLRWSQVGSPNRDEMIRCARIAARVLVLVGPSIDHAAVWEVLVEAGLGDKTTLLRTIPSSVRAYRRHAGKVPDAALFQAGDVAQSLVPSRGRLQVAWRAADAETRSAQNRFRSWDLPLLVEKYFPDWDGKVLLHPVGGGLSGVPLLRFLSEGSSEEYYFKFFTNRGAFVREWNGHRAAVDWLGDYSVNLQPILLLAETGEGQATAFADPPYVMCFEAAQVLTRLKDLYVIRDDQFVDRAYEMVLEALANKQPQTRGSSVLSSMGDIGPAGDREPSAALLSSLRSELCADAILLAMEELEPYGPAFLGEDEWKLLDNHIRLFLKDKNFAALYEDCPVVNGHVHGDANSRNFLFNGLDEQTPKDLQIVDIGGYRYPALRAFDLAQLESDLKIVLMATETGLKDYLDMETSRLPGWKTEEERSLKAGLAYSGPAAGEPSLLRAYRIVARIRREAAALSPEDPAGRAYFFSLLFWTLRKVRLTGVLPRTKRLLALYSSDLILRRLESWHRP